MKRYLGNDLGARCEDCAETRIGGFKKVAALHDSDVTIYLHVRSVRSGSDRCDKSSQTREFTRHPDTFIVYNTSDTEITRNTMVRELRGYKTNCITCKGILKRVRTLLEDVRAIRRNEVYAICDHCKRTGVKCKRCEYVLGKFKETKTEEREYLFKQWLCEVKQLLEAISKGNICKYKLYQDTSDAAELDNLLMELNSPTLAQRQLEIGAFPPMEFQENLAQRKDMLQKLITKLKRESGMKKYSSDDSLKASTACVCKYLMDRKIEQRKALQTLNQQETEPPRLTRVTSKTLLSKVEHKESLLKEHGVKEKDKSHRRSSATVGSVRDKSNKARKGSSTTEKSMTQNSTKARKGSSTGRSSVTDKENKPEKKPNKETHGEESELFKKLLAERSKHEVKVEKQTKETKTRLPSLGELPKVSHIKKKEVVKEFSESILECDDEIMRTPKEMIAGMKLVPFHEHEVQTTDSIQPLLFKVGADCPEVVDAVPEQQPDEPPKRTTHLLAKEKSEIPDRSGVIRYRLSDRQFIEKGWTQLPSTKILRRMNVYKMLPARPNDWFIRHKDKGTMFYDSGVKLAEIAEDGQGKWFYRNRMVALEYYNAEEMFVGKRCVVYSYVCKEVKTSKLQTVLACFDTLGNGVIYDRRGNERLKYNQTEGQLIDEKIGPPGFWKWHTLNDPPVLQKTFVDTYTKDRSSFKKARDDNGTCQHKKANEAMLAIELDKFVKEKADKLLQKFKPFKIRMKTVKINDYFSVRVIDQANVCLLFRDGQVTLKLDLGMLLLSKEIIDTDCVELSCVGTPYDRRPARSMSVDRIQNILLAARGKRNG